MAVTYDGVIPVSGGGLGACKIGIFKLSGTYETGGVDIGIKEEPVFMATDSIVGCVWSNGKVKLIASGVGDAGTEVTADTDVTGVAILTVIKGDY